MQRHVEDDSAVFLHSVQKVADVATNPSQNVLLVQVLHSEVRVCVLCVCVFVKYVRACHVRVRWFACVRVRVCVRVCVCVHVPVCFV